GRGEQRQVAQADADGAHGPRRQRGQDHAARDPVEAPGKAHDDDQQLGAGRGVALRRHSGISACLTSGCSSTQAAAAKIMTKPMMSGMVRCSSSITAEAVTPMIGTSSEPIEAVMAGIRHTIDHHKKCASQTPMMPTKSTVSI